MKLDVYFVIMTVFTTKLPSTFFRLLCTAAGVGFQYKYCLATATALSVSQLHEWCGGKVLRTSGLDSVFAFVFYFIWHEELFSITPRSQSDYTRDPNDGAARLKTTFCETISVDLQ